MMSMLETLRAEEKQQDRKGGFGLIHLSIAAKQKTGSRETGIGIVAEGDNTQVLAQWALKEARAGNNLTNQAVAIKLALCKAREQKWEKIKVKVRHKQLLKMLQTSNSKDRALYSYLDDIGNL